MATGALDLPELPSSTGEPIAMDRFLGKVPVTVTFAGMASSPVTAAVVRGFDDHLADFGASRVQALVVVPSAGAALQEHLPRGATTVPVLADEAGEWRRFFGVEPGSDHLVTTLLLGADGTVVDQLVGSPGGVHAEEVLAMVTTWLADAASPAEAGYADDDRAPGVSETSE